MCNEREPDRIPPRSEWVSTRPRRSVRILDQGRTGASVAFAGAGLMEALLSRRRALEPLEPFPYTIINEGRDEHG